jgi:branched-chain amino acid transport system ATP-binding protein
MGSPRILLLDEPSLGLAPVVVTQVFEVLRTLSSSGLTILLVEQNARLALAHSNRAYVMERGCIAHQGASAQLAQDPAVQAHYFGA